MLVSFIVPVYNRETLLSDAMDSILRSSFNDYEIILVNNGSTDGSGNLCDQYASQYPFVRVLKLEENLGPGGGREAGMAIANGDWLFFMDSDDLLFTENISVIASQLSELPSWIDMVSIDIAQEYHGEIWSYPTSNGLRFLTWEKYLDIRPARLYSELWNFLFRRSFVLKNQLHHRPNILLEDLYFILDAMRCKPNIAEIPTCFYIYRRGYAENSIVSTIRTKRPSQYHLKYVCRICEDIRNWKVNSNKAAQSIYTKYLLQYCLHLLDPWSIQANQIVNTVKEEINWDSLQIATAEDAVALFVNVCESFQIHQIYLAPAGTCGKIIADYFNAVGIKIIGYLDNYSPPIVTTPGGMHIPSYKQFDGAKVCQNIPVLMTDYTVLGAKMEEFLKNQGIQVIRWGYDTPVG